MIRSSSELHVVLHDRAPGPHSPLPLGLEYQYFGFSSHLKSRERTIYQYSLQTAVSHNGSLHTWVSYLLSFADMRINWLLISLQTVDRWKNPSKWLEKWSEGEWVNTTEPPRGRKRSDWWDDNSTAADDDLSQLKSSSYYALFKSNSIHYGNKATRFKGHLFIIIKMQWSTTRLIYSFRGRTHKAKRGGEFTHNHSFSGEPMTTI